MNELRDQGIHGHGNPRPLTKWSATEVQIVLDELWDHHVGKVNAITVVDLEQRVGFSLEGRSHRNLLADLDSTADLLNATYGEWNKGYYLAEFMDEAMAGNHRHESQILNMVLRAIRRREFQATHPLPWRQYKMMRPTDTQILSSLHLIRDLLEPLVHDLDSGEG